jgi:hypothetical protein
VDIGPAASFERPPARLSALSLAVAITFDAVNDADSQRTNLE